MATFDPDRVDLPLLLAVRDIRRDHGACTIGAVAERLRISKASAQDRIAGAIKRGHLVQSEVHGSLRIGPDIGSRLPIASGQAELVTLDEELLAARLV